MSKWRVLWHVSVLALVVIQRNRDCKTEHFCFAKSEGCQVFSPSFGIAMCLRDKSVLRDAMWQHAGCQIFDWLYHVAKQALKKRLDSLIKFCNGGKMLQSGGMSRNSDFVSKKIFCKISVLP